MEPAEINTRGYYCHKCQTTIIPSTEFACPDCNDGFIEKLPGPVAATTFVDRNNEHRDDADMIPPVELLNNFGIIVHSDSEPNLGPGSDNRPSSSNRREASSDTARPNDRRRPRNQNLTGTFEHVLSEFLSTVTRPNNTGNMETNPPVFFLSNPGDYAWGREGLDTIVTQLLNQMDSSGPPPLAKDKIKELPFVAITEEHVSENIQCSVCWDSFNMSEHVRQLPCEHIYHDICIVPWLELHGTCPICRKLLCEDNENRLGFSHSGGLEALLSDVHRLTVLQSSFTSGSQRENRHRHIRCYKCSNYGHFARDCRGRRIENAAARGENTQRSDRTFTGPPSTTFTPYDFDILDDDDEDDDDDASNLDFDDYDSDMFDHLYAPCSVCQMPFGDHMPDCWRRDEFQFDGWENNTVSFSGGSSNSMNCGFGRSPNNSQFRKRKNIKCYNCNQPGHIARDCNKARDSQKPQRDYQKPQRDCQKPQRDCHKSQSRDRCAHCSKLGHKTSDCWFAPDRPSNRCWNASSSNSSNSTNSNNWQRSNSNNSNDWQRNNGFRKNNDNAGQSSFGGPSTSRFQSQNQNSRGTITCYNCSGDGHIARNCPVPTTSTNYRRKRNKNCGECNQPGHTDVDCKYYERNKVCGECNQPGHTDVNCTYYGRC